MIEGDEIDCALAYFIGKPGSHRMVEQGIQLRPGLPSEACLPRLPRRHEVPSRASWGFPLSS